jgi:hypothetical protein
MERSSPVVPRRSMSRFSGAANPIHLRCSGGGRLWLAGTTICYSARAMPREPRLIGHSTDSLRRTGPSSSWWTTTPACANRFA